MVLVCASENDHLAIALHSSDRFSASSRPAAVQCNAILAVPPPLDVAGHFARDGDHRLDRVGGLERLQQVAAQAEPGDRERFLQSLQQAGGGTGMFDVQLLDQRAELALSALGVGLAPGFVQLTADECALRLNASA